MNYLAHLVLARQTFESRAGNLMADWIKGRDAFDALPPGIQRGVVMHRAVDAFTDSHPVVMRSRKRFSNRWRRVSGILVDVYYDHCLAAEWSRYRDGTLRHYLDEAYMQLVERAVVLPEPLQPMLRRLVAEDLLMTYERIEGMEDALRRISQRLRNGEFQLQDSVPEFVNLLPEFQRDFGEFFAEVQTYVAAFSREQ